MIFCELNLILDWDESWHTDFYHITIFKANAIGIYFANLSNDYGCVTLLHMFYFSCFNIVAKKVFFFQS